MQNKEEAKEKLKELVDVFSSASRNKEYILGFSEEDIKNQFIDPFVYDVLGWNRQDVRKEQKILKGRVDYILKIGNEEVLIIEAKRVSVKNGKNRKTCSLVSIKTECTQENSPFKIIGFTDLP